MEDYEVLIILLHNKSEVSLMMMIAAREHPGFKFMWDGRR
jgi:hypothetical protein